MSQVLQLSLTDWSNLNVPHFECTALHVTDYTGFGLYYTNECDEPVEAIITYGTYQGEIIRWMVLPSTTFPISVSFAHQTKVIQLITCTYPLIRKGVASLSVDGTLCIWAAQDGICMAKYTDILPNGCQRLAINEEIGIVSGSFPSVYLMNIYDGTIVRKIHPMALPTLSLSVISHNDEKILFTLDSNGCAAYTPISPKIGATHRYKIVDTENIITAIPSPNFVFLLIIRPDAYTIYGLCHPNIPQFNGHFTDIQSGIWLDDFKFALVSFSGDMKTYKIPSFTPPQTHYEMISKRFALPGNENKPNTGPKKILKRSGSSMTVDPLSDNEPSDDDSSFKFGAGTTGENSGAEIQPPSIDIEISNSDIPLIVPAVWQKQIVLGFESSVFIVAKDFSEYSFHHVFGEGGDHMTAQCLIIDQDEIKAFCRGTATGTIIIEYLGKPKIVLEHIAQGAIVEMWTTRHTMFVSSEDLFVRAISLETNKVVATYTHFVYPVDVFLRPTKRTDTICDRFLFALTRNSVISIINIDTLKNEFVLTGHEGRVKNMYIHPSTLLFLVEGHSLFIWSLKTGNLESVITGHNKERYLSSCKANLVKVKHFAHDKKGFVYEPVRFGGLALRVLSLDIKKIAPRIHDTLAKNRSLPVKEALADFKNVAFLEELFGDTVLEHIWKETGSHYGRSYNIGFVGARGTHTVYMPGRLPRHMLWSLSTQVSAIVLAMRGILSIAMRVHPELSNKLDDILRWDPNKLRLQAAHICTPSVLKLFELVASCGTEVHNFLMRLIELYPMDQRITWLNKLHECFKDTPQMRATMALAWTALATTLINTLSQDQVKEAADQLFSFLGSRQNVEFARTLLSKGMERFATFKPLFMKMIGRTAAENDDPSTLSFFMDNVPTLFIAEANEATEKRKDEARVLLRHLIASITERKSRGDYDHLFLESLMKNSYAIFGIDWLKDRLKMIDLAKPWFSFRPSASAIAYGTKFGSVVYARFVDNKQHNTVLSCARESIDNVDLDGSGTCIFAFCRGSGTFFELEAVTTASGTFIETRRVLHFETDAEFAMRGRNTLLVMEKNGRVTEVVSRNQVPEEI